MRLTQSLPIIAALFLTACASGSLNSGSTLFQSKGEKSLSSGIELYDDGKYGEAVSTLQDALGQGLGADSQVKAHKYLAFAYCVSSKERLCRDEFKKALELKPTLELEPSEAGHPIWGPVFKSVKAKKTDPKK